VKKRPLFLLAIIAFLIAACGTASTQAVEPTEDLEEPPATSAPTEAPTTAPSPEASATPQASATPEGRIFRDDFDGQLAEGWTWLNENPDNWQITADGWLELVGEDAFALDGGLGQNNMLFRDLPPGNVAITAHVQADPDTNFQQAALWLWQDSTSYVDLNRGYCANCVGSGVYFDYRIPGLPQGTYQTPVAETDVYLRIEITADQITLFYSVDGVSWERLGRFGNVFTFQQVGLGVSNVDPFGADDDLTAGFDWFEITTLP